MKSHPEAPDVPMGLSMALAKYPQAMNYFVNQPANVRRQIIDQTAVISSKEEMEQFAKNLMTGRPSAQ